MELFQGVGSGDGESCKEGFQNPQDIFGICVGSICLASRTQINPITESKPFTITPFYIKKSSKSWQHQPTFMQLVSFESQPT